MLLFYPVVAFFFEFESEFGAAGVHNLSFVENVHEVGFYVIEQALVVCDHYCSVVVGLECVHAGGDNAQCVDVESAVCLVENCQTRFEHCHLENLVPLFLAAGETFVDRS